MLNRAVQLHCISDVPQGVLSTGLVVSFERIVNPACIS